MKISLRTIAVLVAFTALIIALVISNRRAYLAETEFGNGDSAIFYMQNGVTLDLSGRTEQSAKDEVQGAAYRILCNPKYDTIFNAISPQIRLDISKVRDDIYQVSCEPIGHVRKADEALVSEYREELYKYFEQHSEMVRSKREK